MVKDRLCFARAKPLDQNLIEAWLTQPHIREWLHGEGLANTLASLRQSFEGTSDYQHWIAYDGDVPFGYLLTSDADQEEDAFTSIAFSGNRAITLDVFIGEPDFLDRGFGTAMIREFLRTQFPTASDVIIDPEAANERAVHVYQKLGFRIIETFIAPWHPVPHVLMHMRGDALKALIE